MYVLSHDHYIKMGFILKLSYFKVLKSPIFGWCIIVENCQWTEAKNTMPKGMFFLLYEPIFAQSSGAPSKKRGRHVSHSRSPSSSKRLPRTTHRTRWTWRTGGLLVALPGRRSEAVTVRKIAPPSYVVTSRGTNSSSLPNQPHFGRLLLVLHHR